MKVIDEELDCNSRLVENPNAPTELLEELFKEKNFYIQWHLSDHHNSIISMLIELSKHDNMYVRDRAKKNRINKMHLLK